MTVLVLPTFADQKMSLESIERGDALYSQRTESDGAKQALAEFVKAASEDPSSVTPLWKAARACYWIADHTSSKKEKLALIEKGIALAQQAIALDPKCVEAHFWLGGIYGTYGETKGIMKSLAMVKPIREEMSTIIRLNDRYQGGAGYRVSGIVDYKVPSFVGGNKKRALEQLNKALAIDPTNAFNLYYMAEFLSSNGGKQQAKEHLKTLQTLTTSEDVDGPDLKMIQEKGRKLQEKI